MSDLQDYLLTVDKDKQGALDVCKHTTTKLEHRQLSLINVVESLGEYINNEDATIRSKAVTYLSQVISALEPAFLSRQQVLVLCQFFCERIEDGGAVGGLHNLQMSTRFNGELAAMTFRAMVEHFQDLQIRPQSQRFQILELLNDLMANYRSVIKEMGSESLVGIVDLVSGEKDPRNLMIIFSILKVIMVEWDYVHEHAETLFDSVFCYFPITFRPPPDDPYGITAQDLKGRLKDCIGASSYFAPFVFPQLLDKLDSTSPNVKKDVLQLITSCALSYDTTTVSNYSVTFWDSLKYEILNAQEEDLAEEALAALQAIAINLSHELNSSDPKTPLARYLRPISKECNEQFQDPQHKQAKPAGKILSSIAMASPIALLLIVKATVPPLLMLYQDAEVIAKRRVLLEVLLQLFNSAVGVYGTHSELTPSPQLENPLNAFKERLFEAISQALMSTTAEEVSFRVLALQALLQLCKMRKYLQDNEIGMAVQYLDEIVLSEHLSGPDDLKNEAIQALVDVSRLKPALIMEITFPAFMARLPDSSSTGKQDYVITLEGLARLSIQKSVSDTLIRRLLSKLDIVLSNEGSPAYAQAILSTLYYILDQRDLANDPNLEYYYEKIVGGLISRAVRAAAEHGPISALNETKSLEILGHLANAIIRALYTHKKQPSAMQIYSLFTEANVFSPIPFRREVPEIQRRTLILSTYIMAALGQSATIPFAHFGLANIGHLLEELVNMALLEDSPSILQSILRQICLIINKHLSTTDIHYATDIIGQSSTRFRRIDQLPPNAIRIVLWMSKGLVLRLASMDIVLEYLMTQLSHPLHGRGLARGFGILLAPDEIVTKENGATIRLLAKQKVFQLCIPRIASDFRQAENSIKPNYLIALSGILRFAPTELLMSDVEILLPLLLQSLDLEDRDVKAATIEIVAIISRGSPAAVESHISSIVNRLLKAASDSKGNAPKVRYNALQCLRIFPGKIKDSTLLPYKTTVTGGIKSVLDDPKRHVRKEAVDCLAAWFNMDEPDDDN